MSQQIAQTPQTTPLLRGRYSDPQTGAPAGELLLHLDVSTEIRLEPLLPPQKHRSPPTPRIAIAPAAWPLG